MGRFMTGAQHEQPSDRRRPALSSSINWMNHSAEGVSWLIRMKGKLLSATLSRLQCKNARGALAQQSYSFCSSSSSSSRQHKATLWKSDTTLGALTCLTDSKAQARIKLTRTRMPGLDECGNGVKLHDRYLGGSESEELYDSME